MTYRVLSTLNRGNQDKKMSAKDDVSEISNLQEGRQSVRRKKPQGRSVASMGHDVIFNGGNRTLEQNLDNINQKGRQDHNPLKELIRLKFDRHRSDYVQCIDKHLKSQSHADEADDDVSSTMRIHE